VIVFANFSESPQVVSSSLIQGNKILYGDVQGVIEGLGIVVNN